MKALGINFDSRISWDIQVDKAILNSRKSLHALRSVWTIFTDQEMIKLVAANVYSKCPSVAIAEPRRKTIFKDVFPLQPYTEDH